MARYVASVESPRPVEQVFAYLSDFANAREWDPGVVEAERLGGSGEIALGTTFRLVAVFLGRRTPLRYEIVEIDPPRRVAFRGENASVVSLDAITFERVGETTRVTYDADLRLKGALRLADPLLKLAFGRVGDRALAGLRAQLAGPQAGVPS